MARKVSYIPTAADKGSVAIIPASEIPQEVIAEVEEIYAALKANPNGRMRAEFDTKAELTTYMTQLVSYCNQRQVNGVPSPLRFRKSPTKGLAETVMDYRISDPLPEKPEPGENGAAATPPATEPAAPATPPAKAPAKKK